MSELPTSSSSSSLPTSSSFSSTTASPLTFGTLLLFSDSTNDFSPYFFLLKENSLAYFSPSPPSPHTSPPTPSSPGPQLGTLSLEGSSVEIVPDSKYRSSFTFELNCPLDSKTYVIQCSSSLELQEWMNSLRRAMLRIRRDKAKMAQQVRKEKQNEAQSNLQAQLAAATSFNNNSNTPGSNTTASSSSFPSSSSSSSNPSSSPSSPPSSFEVSAPSKLDVYRQWLEETKESKAKLRSSGGGIGSSVSHSGDGSPNSGAYNAQGAAHHHTPRSGGMHRQLLEEEEKKKEMCGCDCSKCVIM